MKLFVKEGVESKFYSRYVTQGTIILTLYYNVRT